MLFKKIILEKINYMCYIKKLLLYIKYIYKCIIIEITNKIKGEFLKNEGTNTKK